MEITEQVLRKILVESQIISSQQFDLAVKSAKTQSVPLFQYILSSNIIRDSDAGQLIANYLSLPFINLAHVSIKGEILNIVPEETARKSKVIAFEVKNGQLHIATPNPDDIEIIQFIEKKVKMPVVVHYTTEKDIKDALNLYAKDVAHAFEDILAENIRQVKANSGSAIEPPIIKIIDTIIEYASKNNASDIHLEPGDTYSLLRFRVDGILHDIVKLPKGLHDQLLTRIKVMSDLRTDVRQAPQDGKIHIKINDETLNLRVSIVPILHGEKAVLRVLVDQNKSLNLSTLGFQDDAMVRIQASYKKPYGMILTTGPTGSGKTTTLYAILKELNVRDINIMTIENPVEYEVEGVSQIQVNSKTGLTFANGLRSIVRQDPDVILVGEIRDEETAKIAVNAAMTGHLVLSTLHTNDAATTIPRLFDMGIEPFLVASSTNVVVGQRLVRRICEQCRISLDYTKKEWLDYTAIIPKDLLEKHFENKSNYRVYKGKGCEICNHTGYQGRIGIYEVMLITEEIRRAIVGKSNAAIVADIAKKEGMIPMIEDGIVKAKMGLTTIEEVIRVTKE